jgi:hypothetical protein
MGGTGDDRENDVQSCTYLACTSPQLADARSKNQNAPSLFYIRKLSMKSPQHLPWPLWKRVIALALLTFAVSWLYSTMRESNRRNSFAGVLLTGVQHIGPDFNISDFYVDGYNGSNVGREGGGGSDVCCVMLPKKWRPGLTVELRWAVGDWSKEIPAETGFGNYKSITSEGVYKAKVPVEKYDVPGHVYVHFYAGGKARVVSSEVGSGNSHHPILNDDPHAVDNATKGQPTEDMFTTKELADMDRRDEDRKKKHGGDWR